uniref:ANK_REP_REGION domain-containing protein n=1 Tax=Macrostomum lignano TaxID=282301 RepID=A0A1I8HVA1_9PLAT
PELNQLRSSAQSEQIRHSRLNSSAPPALSSASPAVPTVPDAADRGRRGHFNAEAAAAAASFGEFSSRSGSGGPRAEAAGDGVAADQHQHLQEFEHGDQTDADPQAEAAANRGQQLRQLEAGLDAQLLDGQGLRVNSHQQEALPDELVHPEAALDGGFRGRRLPLVRLVQAAVVQPAVAVDQADVVPRQRLAQQVVRPSVRVHVGLDDVGDLQHLLQMVVASLVGSVRPVGRGDLGRVGRAVARLVAGGVEVKSGAVEAEELPQLAVDARVPQAQVLLQAGRGLAVRPDTGQKLCQIVDAAADNIVAEWNVGRHGEVRGIDEALRDAAAAPENVELVQPVGAVVQGVGVGHVTPEQRVVHADVAGGLTGVRRRRLDDSAVLLQGDEGDSAQRGHVRVLERVRDRVLRVDSQQDALGLFWREFKFRLASHQYCIDKPHLEGHLSHSHFVAHFANPAAPFQRRIGSRVVQQQGESRCHVGPPQPPVGRLERQAVPVGPVEEHGEVAPAAGVAVVLAVDHGVQRPDAHLAEVEVVLVAAHGSVGRVRPDAGDILNLVVGGAELAEDDRASSDWRFGIAQRQVRVAEAVQSQALGAGQRIAEVVRHLLADVQAEAQRGGADDGQPDQLAGTPHAVAVEYAVDAVQRGAVEEPRKTAQEAEILLGAQLPTLPTKRWTDGNGGAASLLDCRAAVGTAAAAAGFECLPRRLEATAVGDWVAGSSCSCSCSCIEEAADRCSADASRQIDKIGRLWAGEWLCMTAAVLRLTIQLFGAISCRRSCCLMANSTDEAAGVQRAEETYEQLKEERDRYRRELQELSKRLDASAGIVRDGLLKKFEALEGCIRTEWRQSTGSRTGRFRAARRNCADIRYPALGLEALTDA